jgi:hypothetical protein
MPRLILSLLASLSLALAACASNTDPTTPGGNTPADNGTTGGAVSERVPDELYPVMPAPQPTESDAPATPENAMNDTHADACNADAARSAIGKTATADVVEQARIAAGAEVARTLKPGQMVTMEFRAGRLNIDVDADNRITNVRCG